MATPRTYGEIALDTREAMAALGIMPDDHTKVWALVEYGANYNELDRLGVWAVCACIVPDCNKLPAEGTGLRNDPDREGCVW